MFCPYCGASLIDEVHFCSHCGKEVRKLTQGSTANKNKLIIKTKEFWLKVKTALFGLCLIIFVTNLAGLIINLKDFYRREQMTRAASHVETWDQGQSMIVIGKDSLSFYKNLGPHPYQVVLMNTIFSAVFLILLIWASWDLKRYRGKLKDKSSE